MWCVNKSYVKEIGLVRTFKELAFIKIDCGTLQAFFFFCYFLFCLRVILHFHQNALHQPHNYGLKMQQFYYTKLMVRLTNISKLKAWNIRKNSRKTQSRAEQGRHPAAHPQKSSMMIPVNSQWTMAQCWHNKTHITSGEGWWKGHTRPQMPQIPIFHKHTTEHRHTHTHPQKHPYMVSKKCY